DEALYIRDRKEMFERTRCQRAEFHGRIVRALELDPQLYSQFGLQPGSKFEVHSLRRSARQTPEGRPAPQVIISMIQERPIKVPGSDKAFTFYGGSTLIVDLMQPKLLYVIRKRVDNNAREIATVSYLKNMIQHPVLRRLFDPNSRNR